MCLLQSTFFTSWCFKVRKNPQNKCKAANWIGCSMQWRACWGSVAAQAKPDLGLLKWLGTRCLTCIPQPMGKEDMHLQYPSLSSGKDKQLVISIVGKGAKEISEINGTWGNPKFCLWGKGLGTPQGSDTSRPSQAILIWPSGSQRPSRKVVFGKWR